MIRESAIRPTKEGTNLMPPIEKTLHRLQEAFGGRIEAVLCNRVLTLSGELPSWAEVVRAGQMAADPHHYSVVNDIRCTGETVPPMRLPRLQDSALEGQHFDVVVIGGGIVGCAIARELSRYAVRVLLLEKEHDVALQASSRNDGMVHPGIDLHPGTLKFEYNLRGNAMYDAVCRELGVPFHRSGQLLGLTEKWLGRILWALPIHWRRRGIPCEYMSRRRMLETEPGLTPEITAGLRFPTAGVVCPYGLTIAYAENAVENGVTLSLDTAVTGMTVEEGRITSLQTNRGTVLPQVVVNAAGVFSEEVAAMAGDRFFSIHPRRGTNSILDKKAAVQIKTIASLVGTASIKATHTKGGGLVHTADENLLVGPDAVETPERENYATERQSIERIFQKQRAALPTLSTGDIITYFTGVRAPTYEEDFVLEKGRATHNIVHAAGIQSPGLTAAPAIGVSIAEMVCELLGNPAPNPHFDPIRHPIPRTAELPAEERDALIRQNPDYGVIICRCEEVSRGEILAALHRPVPCDTVDGVKRRVRPGMGRCQGGFCGPQVAKIIAEEKGLSLSQVLKSGEGSAIVFGSTKEEFGGGSDVTG